MYVASEQIALLSTTLTVVMVQAVPQVEQAADPCSYVNCCWGLSYLLMLVMMVVMVAMSALAVASVLVYMVVSSCVHFLWHLTLMCGMSGALLVVWYACQVNICPCSYLSIKLDCLMLLQKQLCLKAA